MTDRYRHTDLIVCTAGLFRAAGLDGAIAQCVAEILVEAELLGYDTHGLQFIPAYVAGIEAGATAKSGEPRIVRDGGGTMLLDAARLPGQWVVVRAMDLAFARLAEHGCVTAVIRRSENISCLATYVRRAAERGALAILSTSSPGNAAVAPPGGRAGSHSTNPVACGIPSVGHPVLIDTSTASVSNRQIERARRAGAKLPSKVLVDAEGRPSDDPEAFFGDPKGAIMTVGGPELAHKGFAFAAIVEALTSGLAGFGRGDDGPEGSNVFLQLIDPEAFGGRDAFRRQTDAFSEIVRESPPADPTRPVRMPGDRADRLWREQTAQGITLHPEVPSLIRPVFEKYDLSPPTPID